MKIESINLGLIDYQEAFFIQEEKVKQRISQDITDQVLFCTHPSVVTLGRASKKDDVFGWSGSVHKTNRGGRATYHGPGQIIGYPILSLKESNKDNLSFRPQDIRAYLEFIEEILIEYLKSLSLNASALQSKPLEAGQLNRGIWVEDKKIASIGIAVKSWCTMHGFALNLKKDSLAFTGIHACGFSTETYTSLEDFGVSVSYDEAVTALSELFKKEKKIHDYK